jgi:hypothetical protein
VPLPGLVVPPGPVVLLGLVVPLGEVLGDGAGADMLEESDTPAPLSPDTPLLGVMVPLLSLTPAPPPTRLLSAPSRIVSVASTRPGRAVVSTPPAPV